MNHLRFQRCMLLRDICGNKHSLSLACRIISSSKKNGQLVKVLRFFERACLAIGAFVLLVVGIVYLDAFTGSRDALAAFDARLEEIGHPDQARWSDNRRSAYAGSLATHIGMPAAVLSIPVIDLRVPVFAGTTTLALNRGVGHVEGSASPGSDGNVAVAGHRDGFFRGLMHLSEGDTIEVTTLSERHTYLVSEISIVDPLDVSVLEPTGNATLTLITCYPFHYIGNAPERYIVRAIRG